MRSNIISFWEGKVPLWKSYWLVGELLNALVMIIIFNIEAYIFNNFKFLESLPYLNYNDLNIFSKSAIIIWSTYITVGIWRSSENYKGNIIWIFLSLLILSYRIFTLRMIFIH